MSGDVFGNGMLLSRHLGLVAAFDHRHVFLDPAPDSGRSFAERQRLAALPRSSWADYSPDVLSAGAGVFPRTARKVPISPEAQRALGIEVDALTPDEPVRVILCAPVDLLWNGGVGTFVGAAYETDTDVGDRANDRVRVRADQLRCRMVVEGGNLGLSQAARIEYALAGGRINADFIDNAGGVNTSDREVNLKVLLDSVVAAGEIGVAERNRILAACTADVVDAVLADNARQNWAVSVAEAHGPFRLDRHESVIRNITEVAGLDRKSAQLPSDDEVAHRRTQGRGLTRPEIAVLLSHAKNVLSVELAASGVPDDPAVREVLMDYFPKAVRIRFPAQISKHRLGREIVCTQLANHAIDHLGPGFLQRLEDRSGVPSAECRRGYLVVSDLLGFHEVWHGLDTVPLAVTIPIRRAVERTVDHNVCWLLRPTGRAGGTGARGDLAPHLQRLRSWLESSLAVEALRDGGWPAWEAHNAPALGRVRALAADVARSKGSAPADTAALALGVQLMRDLTTRE